MGGYVEDAGGVEMEGGEEPWRGVDACESVCRLMAPESEPRGVLGPIPSSCWNQNIKSVVVSRWETISIGCIPESRFAVLALVGVGGPEGIAELLGPFAAKLWRTGMSSSTLLRLMVTP